MSIKQNVIPKYFQAISILFGNNPSTYTENHSILGDISKFKWENEHNKICVTISLAYVNSGNVPVLSILMERADRSFTYTDWIHFRGEDWAFEATDLSKSTDVKAAIRGFAAAFDQSLNNGLVKVLDGTVWIDVPTFRGVNE